MKRRIVRIVDDVKTKRSVDIDKLIKELGADIEIMSDEEALKFLRKSHYGFRILSSKKVKD